MNILLIDNNDSFTFNIVEMLRQITKCTSFEDKINIIIRPVGEFEVSEASTADRIMISPGPGLPEDYPVLFDLLRKYAAEKNIMGICMGHQVICRYFGAELYNLPDVIHGQPRNIYITRPKSLLFKNIPQMQVGLYHSWAVKHSSIPDELEVTAVSDANIIMAVQHEQFDIHAVQFHPESYITTYGKKLIQNFLNLEDL